MSREAERLPRRTINHSEQSLQCLRLGAHDGRHRLPKLDLHMGIWRLQHRHGRIMIYFRAVARIEAILAQ